MTYCAKRDWHWIGCLRHCCITGRIFPRGAASAYPRKLMVSFLFAQIFSVETIRVDGIIRPFVLRHFYPIKCHTKMLIVWYDHFKDGKWLLPEYRVWLQIVRLLLDRTALGQIRNGKITLRYLKRKAIQTFVWVSHRAMTGKQYYMHAK